MTTPRKSDLWDQWHAASWYVRAAIIAVVLSLLALGTLEQYLGGSGLRAFMRGGRYFLAHQIGPAVEVSALAYWFSVVVFLAAVVSLFALLLALASQWWVRRKRA